MRSSLELPGKRGRGAGRGIPLVCGCPPRPTTPAKGEPSWTCRPCRGVGDGPDAAESLELADRIALSTNWRTRNISERRAVGALTFPELGAPEAYYGDLRLATPVTADNLYVPRGVRRGRGCIAAAFLAGPPASGTRPPL